MTPQVSAQLPLIFQQWLLLPCLQVISWLNLSRLCGALRKHEQLFYYSDIACILCACCLSMLCTRNENNSGKWSGQRLLNSNERWRIKVWSKKAVKIKLNSRFEENAANIFYSCFCFSFFCWNKKDYKVSSLWSSLFYMQRVHLGVVLFSFNVIQLKYCFEVERVKFKQKFSKFIWI